MACQRYRSVMAMSKVSVIKTQRLDGSFEDKSVRRSLGRAIDTNDASCAWAARHGSVFSRSVREAVESSARCG